MAKDILRKGNDLIQMIQRLFWLGQTEMVEMEDTVTKSQADGSTDHNRAAMQPSTGKTCAAYKAKKAEQSRKSSAKRWAEMDEKDDRNNQKISLVSGHTSPTTRGFPTNIPLSHFFIVFVSFYKLCYVYLQGDQ